MDFLGLRHPFFNPLWRRVATVAVCAGWGVFEAVNGAVLWAALFLGLGGVAAWAFFVDWKDVPEDDGK